jgi:hypothetical protein
MKIDVIKVTKPSGRPMWIWTAQLIALEHLGAEAQADAGSVIHTTDGKHIWVREKPEEIVKTLQQRMFE